MEKIFVCGLSPEGMVILQSFVDKFIPRTEIAPVQDVGIISKMSRHGKKPEVLLIILPPNLTVKLKEGPSQDAREVTELPKYHTYTTDEDLKQFLISKFGRLEGDSNLSDSVVDSGMGDSADLKNQLGTFSEDSVEQMVVEEVSPVPEVLVSQPSVSVEELNMYIDIEKQLRAQLATKDMVISNLTSRIEELSCGDTAIQTYVQKIDELEKSLSIREEELRILKISSSSAESTRINDLQLEIKEISAELIRSKEDCSALEFEKGQLTSKIAVLCQELDTVNSQLGTLQSTIEGMDSTSNELVEKISKEKLSLQADYEALSLRYKTVQDECASLSDISAKQRRELADKDVLSNRVLSLEADLESSNKAVKELQDKLSEVRSIDNSEEIQGLTEEVNKLSDIITDLKKNLSSEQSISAKLSSDLTSSQEEVASLTSQLLDTSKLDEYTDKIASLNTLIGDLQSDIATYESKLNDSSDKILHLENELGRLRDTNLTMKEDIDEYSDFINEVTSNIFFRMTTLAFAKAAVDLSVSVPSKKLSNITVFGAGSSESNLKFYTMLKSQLSSAKQDETYLVLDLVTDSFIDMSLGIKMIKPPMCWLDGTDDISKYVVQTQYSNVTAISTGLGYINELFFLNVDWVRRLTELSELADNIIIYVGTLDSVVRTTLFNSFASVCNSYVVVKATPTNLRSTLFHLSGILNISNTHILCFDYVDSSKDVYKLLSQKYENITILQDTDRLNI